MSPRFLRPRATSIALAVATASALALPAISSAAVERIVTPINSTSPQTDVVSSVISLHVPMMAGAAAHPAACDWISYERWKSTDGPANPMDADSVVVLQPGLVEGATAFDGVARNAIREELRSGRHIEVWGIDRRSNCLEDHFGTDYATKTGNPEDAIDYYYRGRTIDGHTFAGFDPNDRVLGDIGLTQTINDYNAVLTNELPSQPWREKHVICGGHSMGGPLTEIYAGWDFDGNPATTTDAGYRQCAGFVGFDTTLNGGALDTINPPRSGILGAFASSILKTANAGTIAAIKSGTIPRHIDLLGINPESMNALEMISWLAANHSNDEATKLVSEIPKDKHMEDFFHLAGSPDLGAYVNSKASIRNYRYTNMALFAQVMDDNAAAYGLVRTSIGFFDGAPVRKNSLADQSTLIPGLGQLVTLGHLAIPLEQPGKQQLTTWRNYNDLPASAAAYTSPDQEVTDDVQFARSVNEGPLNLTENYFPIRLLADQILIASGDRTGDFSHALYPHATLLKPRETVIAGDGVVGANSKPVDPRVIAPGYQHLDVLAAAEKQNNGQPEISSQTLANLVDTAVPR